MRYSRPNKTGPTLSESATPEMVADAADPGPAAIEEPAAPQEQAVMVEEAAQPEKEAPEPNLPPHAMPALPEPQGAPAEGGNLYNWGPFLVTKTGSGLGIEVANRNDADRKSWGGTRVIELEHGGEILTIIMVATKKEEKEEAGAQPA